MRLTYPAAGSDSGGSPESRIIANSVPKMMPAEVARAVSISVNFIPSRKRYGSERTMTSKSKFANIVSPSMRRNRGLGTDQAGNRQVLLDVTHADGDDDVDHDVNERRGGERLKGLERELRHLASAGGQLHESDSQRHGA